MANNNPDIVTRFESEFSPLDSALIRAIASDYDLRKAEDIATVRDYLDTLRASAVAEDDGVFDPSGTSGVHVLDDSTQPGELLNDVGASTSEDTESTSLSGPLSSSSTTSHPDNQTLIVFANLDEDAKQCMLSELFPSLRPNDVAFTLKKCEFNLDRAMDILLNQVFLEDSSSFEDGDAIVPRGIEAFSESNIGPRTRAGKRKKHKKFQSVDDFGSYSDASDSAPTNKWNVANTDISFIASRVDKPEKTISSLYHKQGGSKSKTILAMIEECSSIANTDISAKTVSDAMDLRSEFTLLSFEQCASLLYLTKASTSKAHELAKALADPCGGVRPGRLVPQYKSVKIEDAVADLQASPINTPGHTGSLLSARSAAFENASRYYRRGKSDRLMGGAAAYYASVGRDYNAAIQLASAADADRLVASQSSATFLDLHGVTVKDAVRITSDRVQAWWDGLGESKIPGGGRGIGQGYRVVTGAGRHSEGGVGKLTPAVTRALLQNGWKVEVGSGVLTVTGRMKR